jgi:sporulation protein YlmC with PRC-barrel domain
MIRLADLCGKRVTGADGARIGKVHEVRAKDGRIVALDCGPGGFIERMTGRRKGRRIAWEKVRAVTRAEILVDLQE